ncbi:hypothetical protein [uncultured Pelagimonas sp.]|uniref:hypothetical protein n=1 Tax=uncultured Pelagimonas sp. TaxID=1618102 RepID=UPI00261605B2|nr:hypothetical protein [uncultured Pelagimonas sp.]
MDIAFNGVGNRLTDIEPIRLFSSLFVAGFDALISAGTFLSTPVGTFANRASSSEDRAADARPQRIPSETLSYLEIARIQSFLSPAEATDFDHVQFLASRPWRKCSEMVLCPHTRPSAREIMVLTHQTCRMTAVSPEQTKFVLLSKDTFIVVT